LRYSIATIFAEWERGGNQWDPGYYLITI